MGSVQQVIATVRSTEFAKESIVIQEVSTASHLGTHRELAVFTFRIKYYTFIWLIKANLVFFYGVFCFHSED